MCLMGDFNARTKLVNDFIEADDTIAKVTGCDLFESTTLVGSSQINPDFTWHRYNQDLSEVNRNGKSLISICQALDFKIINGRIGSDKYRGNPTCYKSTPSMIDYVVVNDEMLRFLIDFDIDMFDQCLSDVHCPMRFVLKFNNSLANKDLLVVNQSPNDTSYYTVVEWSRDKIPDYVAQISEETVQHLCTNLSIVSQNVTQEGIDTLCSELNKTMLNAANVAGISKKVKNTMNKAKEKSASLPWFNKDCIQARQNYLKVKNRLKRKGNKSMANKETKKYKKFIKSQERLYYVELNKKIRYLRSNNAKEYWKLINKSTEGKQEYSKIALQTFLDHFKKLSQNPDHDVPSNCTVVDSHRLKPVAMEQEDNCLNELFCEGEINDNINKLKNNKAGGLDEIRNEFLKHAPPSLVTFICDFFNLILESGVIPDIWCKGLIMPLYKKKGDRIDPNNYRGITLLSCLGKLFTSCLNSRISHFLFSNGKIGYEQAGFRPEFSTLDHIFSLHAIIEYYKCKNRRVYCAFVDYSKAFDMVDRTALWSKMLAEGINGKILTLIYNLYAKAKSCVRYNNQLSDFFSCNIGVRQGENLSPILFSIYLNDFQNTLRNKSNGLNALSNEIQGELEVFLKLYTLLYADDTIIMAESAAELQEALNGLHEYCKLWSLTVNISKTKIVIFSKGKVRKYPKFYLDQNEIEVSEEYVYLGVTFTYNGTFTRAVEKQINQARKAMFVVLERSKMLKLPFDIVCELYEKCVIPVLLYGSEIWGWANLREIEIFHRNFLRMVLKTFKFTPNCMLYGESGCTDMDTKITSRMINFWAKKKLNNGNSEKFSAVLCQLMQKLTENSPDQFQFKWLNHIKTALSNSGFYELWESKFVDVNWLKSAFSQRLADIFQQKWHDDVMNNSQCTFYKLFKETHQQENYLSQLSQNQRIYLSKFRTRTNHLPITKARFHNNQANVNCPLCPGEKVGDELHYIFDCDYFRQERIKLFPSKFMTGSPSVNIMELFSCDAEKKTLENVACFVKIIMNKFTYTKTDPQDKENVDKLPKKIRTTRSGRVTKPPDKLSL